MSLPAGQQRTLDGIAESLRLTEPRLTVMFAIFTRLAKNEPPPCREQIPVRKRVAWLPARWQRPLARHGKRRGPEWRRVLIISQLAIAFIALVVLTFATSHTAAGCGDGQRPHAAALSLSRQKTCLAPGSADADLAGR